MNRRMNKSAAARRPSSTSCSHCGERVSLVRCGVPEHERTRTRKEQLAGRCPGRVYAHDATGGIECADGTILA